MVKLVASVDPSADLKDRLLARLGTSDAAHDVSHARRVWKLCRQIAIGEGIEPSVSLLASACLHDLVTLPKDHPNRSEASRLSANAARPILTQEGLSAKEIDAAAHAIEAHSFSANISPETQEARILQDADRIEALGAIGIARVFAVSGSLNRPLWHPTDPFADDRTANDTEWALDHFEVKLMRLPDMMTTQTGKEIAGSRAKRMREFLAMLHEELGPAIV